MSENMNIPPEREFAYTQRAVEEIEQATQPVMSELGKAAVLEATNLTENDSEAPGMVDRLIEDSRQDVQGDEVAISGVADEADQYLRGQTGWLSGEDLADAKRSGSSAYPTIATSTIKPTSLPDEKPSFGVSWDKPEDQA